MENMIYKIINITKTYMLNKIEVNALRGVSLNIYKNDSIALIGPSGSGKSTLLHLLGTIDKPTSGSIEFKDYDISKYNDEQLSKIRSTEIGFIFQNFNLIPILSVFENIEYPLRIRDLPMNKERKEKIYHLIEEVGLKDHKNHKPGELSGGQRQRVAIARALVIEPTVILADEPTANLDSKTGDKILELIKKLTLKYNSTVVFSTHDNKIMNFVKKQIILNDGQVSPVNN